MKEMILMIGIPGSGKSYYVNNTLIHCGFQCICRDDLRMIYPKYPDHEPIITTIANSMCRSFLKRGLNVVIDETNLKTYRLEYWANIAKEYDYNTTGILMDTDVNLCITRRKKTNFPIDTLNIMNEQWNKIKDDIDFITFFDEFRTIDGGKLC